MSKPREVPAVYADLLSWAAEQVHAIHMGKGLWSGENPDTHRIVAAMDSSLTVIKNKHLP